MSWYFEPSQPQRITSGLKQTSICPQFTPHTSHQTTNSLKTTNQSFHKFICIKTYANIKHKIFEELVPSVLLLLKKHIRLGHAGIMDHLIDISITDLKKSIKKEWTEAIQTLNILYKCITANTSVIWQHAAHTTDQLSSPNR